jgi:hypothetical protein
MDNNGINTNSQTQFENDLQDILTDYLTQNIDQLLGESAETLPTFGTFNSQTNAAPPTPQHTPPHNASSAFNTDSNYHIINRILDNLNTNMNSYHRNFENYCNTIQEMMSLLPDRTNVNTNQPRRFTRPFTPNVPITPISTTRRNPLSSLNQPRSRTNVAQPSRFDHVLTYTINSPNNNLFTNTNNNAADIFSTLFQNVTIRPTAEQIENATELLDYTERLEIRDDRCPISLEEFQEGDQVRRIMHCGHTFNELSFQSWFNSNVRCPVCRYDIRETANQEENNDNSNTADETSHDTSFNELNTQDESRNYDSSSNLAFRLEIPLHYTEIYDESNNLIRRDFQ